MRNYIVLNNNNSNEIEGLLIQSLPPISKPLMRTAIEEIDGRDGDIVTTLGYSAYDKEMSIGLYGSYDVDAVIKYFSDNMTGQVTFSNEPNKYYNYEIINQIDFERLIRFKTAIVTFHVQPFKYPVDETPVEIAYQYINNEAEEMALDNTADAPMTLAPKGNIEQDGEPTPTNPVDIHIVSGDNEVIVGNAPEIFKMKQYATQNSSYYTYSSETGLTAIAQDNRAVVDIPAITDFETNKTYNIIGTTTARILVSQWSSSNGWIKTDNLHCGDSFTTASNTARIRIKIDQISTFPTILGNIYMSTTTEYQNQKYEVDLPVENLFDKDNVNIFNGYPDYGKLTAYNTHRIVWIPCKPNTTYTTQKINQGSNKRFGLMTSTEQPAAGIPYTSLVRDDNKNNLSITSGANDKYLLVWCYVTNDTGVTWQQVLDSIQIEKGTKANSYTPFGTTPIEVGGIGEYEDEFFKNTTDSEYYDSTLELDKWYLKKRIGKVVLDGSENWNIDGQQSGLSYRSFWTSVVLGLVLPEKEVICDKLKNNVNVYSQDVNGIMCNWQGNLRLKILDSSLTTTSALLTYLSNNKLLVYYVLATPENILLNDTLQEQLDDLRNNARSFEGRTHITQNANDKPFMLNATAIQSGSDTGNVDNQGNIYSKPTLDIEGSGTIGIYLNDNQMFSVDLSNSNECIIDVTNLEAYDPSTSQLMNRQVTGDYSKFTLPVGENEIKVSGNVTKATISNYTRWL